MVLDETLIPASTTIDFVDRYRAEDGHVHFESPVEGRPSLRREYKTVAMLEPQDLFYGYFHALREFRKMHGIEDPRDDDILLLQTDEFPNGDGRHLLFLVRWPQQTTNPTGTQKG